MVRLVMRVVLWTVAGVAVVAGLTAIAVWRELTQDLPAVTELLDYRPPTATRVYAADGTPIGEFYVERRYLVPIAAVPEHVRRAFLAAEDAEFYRHRGIDPAGIARALLANFRKGEIVQGASTITQQVVKQLLLTPERSLERKSKELILALELEAKLTKDEIFYLYLNHIYFGAGTYGISAAALSFFDVEPASLSLAQAALLAGLPQAPSRYDPRRHPEAARRRQEYVLDRMLSVGFIDRAEHAAALAEPITIAERKSVRYEAAPWYVEHVRTLLEEEYGSAFATLGLQVQTPLDLELQATAEEVLHEGLARIERRLGRRVVRRLAADEVDEFLARQRVSRSREGPQEAVVTSADAKVIRIRTPWEDGVVPRADGTAKRAAASYRRGDVVWVDPVTRGDDGVMRFALDTAPQIEGALVAIDLDTGQVKAMVGGVDFRRSQFNRAVQARRQPGSAFKPFIYAAALDHGYTATTVVHDGPIALPDGRRGSWTPKNFDNLYMGSVPLRTALVKSLNTASVRVAMDVGIDRLRDHLRIFGFPTEFPRHLSLALGTSEVTLLDLTRAYGVFATMGRRFDPVFVSSVSDAYGQPSDFPGSRPRFSRVLNPATAYVVADMMRGVIESGTAREAKKLGRPAAGKTGTTNESMDAWFVGFTPELLVGVWVGFDAERTLGSYTGGRAAAPIWTEFMERALEGRPVREFAKPDDVTLVRIDAATGLLAVQGRSSRVQAFVAGTEPKRSAPRPTAAPDAVTDVQLGEPDGDPDPRAARR
ncbi:MAG: PBP1A family penicillin-binding protein [Thermodesulfobacteriota bacterium]